MRILTINYPKQENDDRKIDFMLTNYQKKCLPAVMAEAKELKLEPLQLDH